MINKTIIYFILAIFFALIVTFSTKTISNADSVNTKEYNSQVNPEKDYQSLFDNSYVFWGNVEINKVDIQVSPEVIVENDGFSIDLKNDKKSVSKAYYFEITDLKTEEKLYFQNQFLPAKIKPFSFDAGKYQISVKYKVDGNYFQGNKIIEISDFAELTKCDQEKYCENSNIVYNFIDKINASTNYQDYGRYFINISEKYKNEIFRILHGEDSKNNLKIYYFNDPEANFAYTQSRIYPSGHIEKAIYFSENEYIYPNLDGFRKFYFTESSAGVIIHELAHYLKTPKNSNIIPELTWINEGVSDYVRDKLGYSSNINKVYPHCEKDQTYLNGYMCAADFFIFIENKYHKNIPQQFVYQLEKGIGTNYESFTNALFNDFIGKDVEVLWSEYLTGNNIY